MGPRSVWRFWRRAKFVLLMEIRTPNRIRYFASSYEHRGFIVLANNQLDALFRVFIYFISLHVSSITVLIIRRCNCINTSSGTISLCK